MKTMRWLFAMGCLALAAVTPSAQGCAGDDATPEAEFAEQCDGECAEGLICVNRVCSLSCTNDQPCRMYHPQGVCQGGYCYQGCSTAGQCQGISCVQSGSTQATCRVQ